MGRRSILITGAAGYVGGLLVDAMAGDARYRVIATDVRPLARQDVIFVQRDIRAPGLEQVLREYDVDTVVHLAAIVTPGRNSDPRLEYEVDVVGTQNVLEACVDAGVQRVVVTSSGAAYGYHADNPPLLTEDHPLRGNDDFPYARHKRLVEELLARYRHDHPQLEQVVFRVATILGKTTKNQITALFERRVLLGVRGSNSPFCFVSDEDVVGALRQAIEGGPAGVYNLSGDGNMTIDEIGFALGKRIAYLPPNGMRAVLALLKTLRLTRYGPEQVKFLQYRPVLDNARLKAEFGYSPRYTSRDVFSEHIEAARQNPVLPLR